MFALWNLLRGRKTYLLALVCIVTVLLHAAGDSLQGKLVDWNQVVHQVLACLMTMALRHGLNGNTGSPSSIDVREYEKFDR